MTQEKKAGISGYGCAGNHSCNVAKSNKLERAPSLPKNQQIYKTLYSVFSI